MSEQKQEKPRRTRGTGGIFKPKGSRFFWIKYVSGGKTQYESTKSERVTDARNLLTSRLGDVSRGIAVTPQMGKLTLGDGLSNVETDYKINGKRSLNSTVIRIKKHLLAWDGWKSDTRMVTITTDHVRAYTLHRLEQGAAPASINRELAIIRRAFSLAVKGGTLTVKPHVPMLAEDNVRTGFFELAEFEAVRAALPVELRGIVTLAYFTGMRVKSEIQPMEWSQVDRDAKVIRLHPGTTKNKKGRVLPYGKLPELVTVIDTAWQEHERLKAADVLSPFVFQRDGEQIKDFGGAWDAATVAAGYPGKLLHDFRRTAVRNLVRRGVPEKTAMQITGHKTRSVFDRYDIVTERDIEAGLGKLTDQPAAVEPKRQRGKVRQFPKRTGTEG